MDGYGTLTDYNTGEPIRPATFEEWQASANELPTGAFVVDRDGDICDESADDAVFGPKRVVFVDGGPDPTPTP